MRTEEADGYLENLLVRPVSRTSWFAGRLGLSSLLILTAGLLAGIGAWAGAASQHSGVRFGSLLTAGLNVVPPGLFLLGLGALVLGAWPRRTSTVVYGYLAWSFLIEFAGGVVHTSHWLLDTSVFFHMVPAPASQSRLAEHGGHHRPRDRRSRPRRHPSLPSRPEERMTQRSAGLTADAADDHSRAGDPGGPQRDPHGLGNRAGRQTCVGADARARRKLSPGQLGARGGAGAFRAARRHPRRPARRRAAQGRGRKLACRPRQHFGWSPRCWAPCSRWQRSPPSRPASAPAGPPPRPCSRNCLIMTPPSDAA